MSNLCEEGPVLKHCNRSSASPLAAILELTTSLYPFELPNLPFVVFSTGKTRAGPSSVSGEQGGQRALLACLQGRRVELDVLETQISSVAPALTESDKMP